LIYCAFIFVLSRFIPRVLEQLSAARRSIHGEIHEDEEDFVDGSDF